MPVCDKYDINMAIHPDDPGWSVFGLPRIISSQEKLKRMMDMVPNKHNGVTFCMGSYGTNLNNDLIATIHMLKGRIHFAHIRNLRFNDGMRDFERAHISARMAHLICMPLSKRFMKMGLMAQSVRITEE